MKVLHVVPRIAARASGPSYSVVRLCQALESAGAEVALHVLEPLPNPAPALDLTAYPTLPLPGAWRLGWSPRMRRGLVEAARGADIVHNHSLWMMPNIYCHAAARAGGSKLVFSPRGTLSEWARARSRGRKRLVWWAGQRRALFGANALHATSSKELEEIREAGLEQPAFVIPNGVDVPQPVQSPSQENGRVLLFLSRIHPAKNVETLLRAWVSLQEQHPRWRLVLAGPLAGEYPRAMQSLAENLGLKRVEFVGEVAGAEKARWFQRAELFVLPTRTENFGIAVAEALAHGTPVVVSRGAPWGGVEKYRCGWWVETDGEALVNALSDAMNHSREILAAMGERGRSWMHRDFSWPALGAQMLGRYEQVLDQPVAREALNLA